MKQTKNEVIKPIFYRQTAFLTLLILVSICAVLTVLPPAFSQSSDPKPAATPKPTPAEKVLDEDAAEELIAELKKSLDKQIDDDEAVDEIVKKWDADELVGKTRRQALEILFADVKSVVEDAEITDKLWASWNSDEDENKLEGESVVLDDKRKKALSSSEMGAFLSHTGQTKTFNKENGNYKGQTYTIFKDSSFKDSDEQLKKKVAAIHKAVKTIIDKGLKIPSDLRVYCPNNISAMNQAFKRDLNWQPIAWVTLGIAGGKANALSASGFGGFDQPTITTIHEIGHILHERSLGDPYYPGPFINGVAATASKVSGYAEDNKKEFVAEVFAGLIIGKKFPADVMAEYEKYKGPKVK